MNRHTYPPVTLAWAVWGLAALLYLIGFFQRVAPAVMTGELMQEFDLDAAALGNLSAFYFYSYVAMQLPTGILADRLGPRKLLSLGALVAGLGAMVFAGADSAAWAGAGRLLVGGSVAVAFVGMLKLASHWFVARHFAMVSGMALFVGIIGAVSAGVPLRLGVEAFGWRPLMMGSAVFSFLVAITIWVLVRDDPSQRGYASHATRDGEPLSSPGVLAGLAVVLRNRNAWLLFLVPGAVVGAVLSFSGLWGVPYLTSHYDLTQAEAAALNTLLLVSWAVGGPLFGWMSDRMGLRKPLYAAGCLVLLVGWWLLLMQPGLPYWALVGLILLVGFTSGNMIITFAFAKESVPSELAGTVSGFCNMGVMMGPMLLQPAIGWMLDQYWQGEVVDGVRRYGIEAYQAGFAMVIGWLALALVLILLTRETHCRALAETKHTG